MARTDRYLLAQFLALFGFFALVLVGVYWINRAVGLFDQLVGDGQSALVFVEFSLLTLPNVIRLVLPFAGFAAAIYVTNRMTQESELTVMQAAGVSPFRMARAALIFGLIVAGMMAVLVNLLVPLSRAMVADRRAEISENVTARFLKDGQFIHPSPGITLYIREISAEGELLGLFLEDDRNETAQVTYTAGRALFLRGDSGPKLLMFDGMAQSLTRADRRLAVTRFADFTFDLGALLTGPVRTTRDPAELPTTELIFPDAQVLAATGTAREELVFEGHARLAEPFQSLSAALIGFACLISGGFSRFGLWRQIVTAVVLVTALQAVATVATSMGLRLAQGWALAYVAPVLGLAAAAVILWQAGRPRRVLASPADAVVAA